MMVFLLPCFLILKKIYWFCFAQKLCMDLAIPPQPCVPSSFCVGNFEEVHYLQFGSCAGLFYGDDHIGVKLNGRYMWH